jgi:predicted nucleic acid-binding protein
LWISRQIIREYLATLTRPQTWGNPQLASVLIREVGHFQSRFLLAEDGPTVTEHLLDLLARFSVGGKQIHDANIVATMLAHGVRRLLTNNVDDFARFAGVITIVPLA